MNANASRPSSRIDPSQDEPGVPGRVPLLRPHALMPPGQRRPNQSEEPRLAGPLVLTYKPNLGVTVFRITPYHYRQ